jgi:tetratricopeptide (TPR) repeat protein
MITRKTFFQIFFVAIFVMACVALRNSGNNPANENAPEIKTKYGAYLAAQHAIYVNDFDSANKFIQEFADVDYESVQNTRIIAEFLSGKIPTDIKKIASDKNPASRIVYDAYLVKNGKWDEVYNRHINDKSALYAPFRIWAGVAKNRITETLKYIDSLDSNSSWRAFMRGQIYAEQGNIEKAAGAFANIGPEFLNINDYLYLMSFYTAHNLVDEANALREKFSSTPGGMFMTEYDNIPDWNMYSGYQNALAFNLVQNVSHTKIMLFSDLSVLMLRFAQIVGPESLFFKNTVDYYIGQFYVNSGGNYAKFFNSIDFDNPFYLFGQMQIADESDSLHEMKKILRQEPLFIPALNKVVARHTANGDKEMALRTINQAIRNSKISDQGRAYLLKRRALIYLLFDDIKRAQRDVHDASKILSVDGEVLAIQARIWVAQGREMDNAYEYALTMVKKNPTDIVAWDTLAVVVNANEGTDAAFEILERVGASATSCSSLFEHLGDAYLARGNKEMARESYNRAIELANDGLSVIPKIQKKIRKIK